MDKIKFELSESEILSILWLIYSSNDIVFRGGTENINYTSLKEKLVTILINNK